MKSGWGFDAMRNVFREMVRACSFGPMWSPFTPKWSSMLEISFAKSVWKGWILRSSFNCAFEKIKSTFYCYAFVSVAVRQFSMAV